MYSTILIPIDGSDEANKGLQIGCKLAEAYNSKVILVCVTDKKISDPEIQAAVNEGLIQPTSYQNFSEMIQYPEVSMSLAESKRDLAVEKVAGALAEKVVENGKNFTKEQHVAEVLTLVREGNPAAAITNAANGYNVDLVVMGSHGRKGINALFHPSVAEHVRKHAKAHCLVLTPPNG